MTGPDPLKLAAYGVEIETIINNGSYAIQQVFPTSDDGVWFAYTIGLYPLVGAEILVRGFGQHCQAMCSFVAEQLIADDSPACPGIRNYNPEDPVAMVRLDEWRGDRSDFGICNVIEPDFDAYHAVFCDDEGRWPEDPGCECAEFQMKGLPENPDPFPATDPKD